MKLIAFVFSVVFVVSACGALSPVPPAREQAVAMPDTFSADAAMAVLQDGGNAVDAAIAAQFVLAVTLPEAGNLGGGGFMTLTMNGQPYFLDYREKAPGLAHRDMYLDENGDVIAEDSLYGAKASGVPGTVAGMWAAHKKFGSLPWARLVEPAIQLARNGFIVPEGLADNARYFVKKTREKGLQNNFATYFGKLTAGKQFVQPALANTLEHIRDQGRDGFYQGPVADLLVAFMQAHDGLISHDDLTRYEAKWRAPLKVNWRGFEIITAPPPSSGGIAVIQWLRMLDEYARHHALPAHNSVQYLHVMAEIGKRVFADRAEYLGDPDFVTVPVDALISAPYFARRASEINPDAISPSEPVEPGLIESEDTTHFSVMDKWGNAVANTTTLNLTFGSGMVVDGAGFLLNDEMDDFSAKPGVPNFFGAIGGDANAIEADKRMLSSMTPTLVKQDGDVVLVTGSPGGTTIISSVAQSVINAMWYEMDAQQSVNAPRFHHQLWPKDTLRMHPGFDASTRTRLREMGYVLDDRRFGDVHLIKRTEDGLDAASEKSGRGKAIVLKEK
ncbi:gamma-glutamyltransferase [Alteromonas sp. CYL-A6]|uniref:gamma-glutamyltransferase n=1 Tax=Alteromonas nitratireducens TaxID=3390813 RepID=UPI0034A93A6A